MGIFLALAVIVAAGCEVPGGPGAPDGGGGAGLVILLPGAGTGRALDEPGAIGHQAVQRLLTYEISLTGPGGAVVTREAAYGQSMEFTGLESGSWTISGNAFFRDHGNLQANDPASNDPAARPQTVTLAAGETRSAALTLDLAPALEQVVLIPDAETFKKIGLPAASGGWLLEGKTFLLLADLTLDNWEGPKIAGAGSSPPGRAVFEGGGHTVRINSFAEGAGNYGLFADAWRADIMELKIILALSPGPGDVMFAGGLTATGSDLNIKAVHVSGSFHAASAGSFGSYAGGLAGEITGGTVAHCSSMVDLKLENSAGTSYAGGLVGEMAALDLFESFARGAVEAHVAGGLAGRGGSGGINIIKHCYSAGTVRGINRNGPASAGGIAGTFDGANGSVIGGCYSAAEVACRGDSLFLVASYAGGIAGTLGTNGTIEDCLALNPSVAVNDPSSFGAGRVAGLNGGTLINNRARAGMPLVPNDDPGIPDSTDTSGSNGANISLRTPPGASDFDGTELDTGQTWSAFVMPPAGWDYPYPVLSWQIAEGGIQP
jgi:hypothetical protein